MNMKCTTAHNPLTHLVTDDGHLNSLYLRPNPGQELPGTAYRSYATEYNPFHKSGRRVPPILQTD